MTAEAVREAVAIHEQAIYLAQTCFDTGTRSIGSRKHLERVGRVPVGNRGTNLISPSGNDSSEVVIGGPDHEKARQGRLFVFLD